MNLTPTHYDVLGVRPGDAEGVIRARYHALVQECIEPNFLYFSPMRVRQGLDKLLKYTEAFRALAHSEERDAYNRRLRQALLLCPVCDGKGVVGMGEKDMFGQHKQFLGCAACRETGKAT